MRIAVLGATGYIGGRLVPELLAAGHEVVCVARRPEQLADRDWRPQVEVVRGDALDGDSLVAAFAGVDAAYHLVHSMGLHDDFVDADRAAATNVREAAEANGVRHVVYLGGLGDDADPDLSPHLRSRHEVGAVLGAGRVPVTELRAAIIIGSGSASFEMLRSLVDVLPAMVVPRWVTRTRCQPIAIADVLALLVGVLDDVPDGHRVLDVGGPDVVTYREMMDLYADVAGLRRRLIVPVPVLTPLLSSHWINVVTPLPIGLARPLVESQVNDVLVRPEHDAGRLLGREPIPFRDAVARALRRVQDLEVRTSWADAGAHRPAEPLASDPDWSGGTLLDDVRVVTSSAPPADVFAEFASLGGDRGWLVADWTWSLRGFADELLGGVGRRRGRRHPTELRLGDVVDFFRVEALEPGALLRLRAEMKVPGEAWLEWRVASDGHGGSELTQRAVFHPRGIAGRLYWYVLLPVHAVIFEGMAARLVAAAEARRSPRLDAPPEGDLEVLPVAVDGDPTGAVVAGGGRHPL